MHVHVCVCVSCFRMCVFACSCAWGALWREAAAAGAVAPCNMGQRQSLKEVARSVDTFVKDSLMGKAVARVVRDTPFAVGRAVYEALGALFPSGAAVPAAPQGVVPISPQVRERMIAEARKLLARWPSRAAPGPNGSRFEHWGAVTLDQDSWEAAAQVVVMFALGECSRDFLEANLGARLFALRRPNGKLRPIACGLCCDAWRLEFLVLCFARTSSRHAVSSSMPWAGLLAASWFTKPFPLLLALLRRTWC